MAATQPLQQHVLTALEHYVKNLTSPFDADAAVFFFLDGSGSVHEVARHGDVYLGLQEMCGSDLLNHVAVGVMTCGWAAPVTDETSADMPPSANPGRERVALCVAVNTSFETCSAALLQNAEAPISEAMGEGPLADALAVTMLMLIRKRNAARRLADA